MQVKTNHGLFPKKFIADTLDGMPGSIKIVLKGTALNEVPLVAIGYRYSAKPSLFFITTEYAGNTMLGNPYIMKYTDDYGNLCT